MRLARLARRVAALAVVAVASGGCGGDSAPAGERIAAPEPSAVAGSEVASRAVDAPPGPGRRRPAPRRIVAPTCAWLLAHQAEDGRWSAAEPGTACEGKAVSTPTVDGGSSPDGDVGATALAVLAFLSAGFTNRSDGPEGAAVTRAIGWLRSEQQADGSFGARPLSGGLADQAVAVRSWVEVQAMTGSAAQRPVAQRAVRALLASRRPDGTWGRAVGSTSADPRATAWGLRVLVVAGVVDRAERRAGRVAVYELGDDVRHSVLRLLEDEATPIDLATRAQLRLAVGIPRAVDPWFHRAIRELEQAVPTVDAVRQDLEGWWARFGLLRAAGHGPGEAWERALFEAIARLSRTDGDVCGARGSVDPDAGAREHGGRVASTAMGVLLESLCWTCTPSDLRWLPSDGPNSGERGPAADGEGTADGAK
ncbi:MAG: prenyltransferase/squalene oxidase repeat-containing protein [Planctomycetota bacterium]